MAENSSVDLDELLNMSLSMDGIDDIKDMSVTEGEIDVFDIKQVEDSMPIMTTPIKSSVNGMASPSFLSLRVLTPLEVSRPETPLISARGFASPFNVGRGSIHTLPGPSRHLSNQSEQQGGKVSMCLDLVDDIPVYKAIQPSIQSRRSRSLHRSFHPLPSFPVVDVRPSVQATEYARNIWLSRSIASIRSSSVVPLLQRCINELEGRHNISESLSRYNNTDPLLRYPSVEHVALTAQLDEVASWPCLGQVCCIEDKVYEASGSLVVERAGQTAVRVDGEVLWQTNIGPVLFIAYRSVVGSSMYLGSCTVHDFNSWNTAVYTGTPRMEKVVLDMFSLVKGIQAIDSSVLVWGLDRQDKPVLCVIDAESLKSMHTIKIPSAVTHLAVQPHTTQRLSVFVTMKEHMAVLRLSSGAAVAEWVLDPEYKLDSYSQCPFSSSYLDSVDAQYPPLFSSEAKQSLLLSPQSGPASPAISGLKSPVMRSMNKQKRNALNMPTLTNCSIILNSSAVKPDNPVFRQDLSSRIAYSRDTDQTAPLTKLQKQLDEQLHLRNTGMHLLLDPSTVFQYNSTDEIVAIYGDHVVKTQFPTLHKAQFLPASFASLDSHVLHVSGGTGGLVHVSQLDKPVSVAQVTNTQDNYTDSDIYFPKMVFSLLAHAPNAVSCLLPYQDGFISADVCGKVIIWEFSMNRFTTQTIIDVNSASYDVTVQSITKDHSDTAHFPLQGVCGQVQQDEERVLVLTSANQFILHKGSLLSVHSTPQWPPSAVYASPFGTVKLSNVSAITKSQFVNLSALAQTQTIESRKESLGFPHREAATVTTDEYWIVDVNGVYIALRDAVSSHCTAGQLLFLASHTGTVSILSLPCLNSIGHIDQSLYDINTTSHITNLYAAQIPSVTMLLSIQQATDAATTTMTMLAITEQFEIKQLHSFTTETPHSVKYCLGACGCLGLYVLSKHSCVLYPAVPCSVHTGVSKIFTTKVIDIGGGGSNNSQVNHSSVFFTCNNSTLAVNKARGAYELTCTNTGLNEAVEAVKSDLARVVNEFNPEYSHSNLLSSLGDALGRLCVRVSSPPQPDLGSSLAISSTIQDQFHVNEVYSYMEPAMVPLYMRSHQRHEGIQQHFQDIIRMLTRTHCKAMIVHSNPKFMHSYSILPQYISKTIDKVKNHAISLIPVPHIVNVDTLVVQRFLQGRISTSKFECDSQTTLLTTSNVDQIIRRVTESKFAVKKREIDQVEEKLKEYFASQGSNSSSDYASDVNYSSSLDVDSYSDDKIEASKKKSTKKSVKRPSTATSCLSVRNHSLSSTATAITTSSTNDIFSEAEMHLLKLVQHVNPENSLCESDVDALKSKLSRHKLIQEDKIKALSVQAHKMRKMIVEAEQVLASQASKPSVVNRAEARVHGQVYKDQLQVYQKKRGVRDHLLELLAVREQHAEKLAGNQVKDHDQDAQITVLTQEWHGLLALTVAEEARIQAERDRGQVEFLRSTDAVRERERIVLETTRVETEIAERQKTIEYLQAYLK